MTSPVESLDGDGADFVLWDLSRGVEGGVGQDIGSRLGELYEGDEYLSWSHGLGELGESCQRAPTGDEPNRRSLIEAEALDINRVDGDRLPRRDLG